MILEVMKTMLLLSFYLAAALLWHGASSMNFSYGNTNTVTDTMARSIAPRDLSGTFSNNFHSAYAVCIDWSASQDSSSLRSTVTAKLYLKKTASNSYRNYNKQSPSYSITIDGSTYSGNNGFDFAAGCAVGTTQSIGSASKTVSHNADGSRSVGISASFATGVSWGTVSTSGTAYLNTLPVYVKVTYNGNGGSVSTSSKTVQYGNTYGSLATPTRDGYNFINWYTESSGGSAVTASTKVTKTYSHTIYAHWSAKTLKVTYNGNGGSVSTSSKTVTYASTYGSLATPTRDGYNFINWYTSSSGGSVVTSSTKVTKTSDHTIYAHWSAKTLKVTFNPNGGSVTTTSKTVTYASTYSTLPTPTRDGYNFINWYTSSSGGSVVTSSTKVTKTYSHTIYAHWSANNYTVKFDGNGANNVSKVSMIVTYDQSYEGIATATRTGYAFVGWYTALIDGNKTDASTKVTISNNHTLYALWIAENYTITFNATGGVSSQSTKDVTFNDTYETLPTATRNGYTFAGWFTAFINGIEITNETRVLITNNTTLYARWIINNYTFTFVYDNGTEPVITVLDFNEDIDYPENATREGYTFVCWDENITEMPARDLTITALWIANNYTVTFNATGGISSRSSKDVTFNDTYGSFPDVTRDGYIFAGWFTGLDGSGNTISPSSTVSIAGDHTLYVRWIIINYTLTFNYDNGTEPDEIKLDFDEVIDYPENVTKEGYTFVEWDNDIKTMPAHDVTITALWEINNYTLTFVYNDGTEPDEFTLDFDEVIDYPEDIKKEGYTFERWDKSVTNMPAHDLTITALWEINNYTLIFDYDNGTEPDEFTLDFDEVIDYPENVTKEGYIFVEWDNEVKSMPAHDITITALWEINNYTLIFDYDNGTEPDGIKLDFDEIIDYPENVTKEGYIFVEWDNDIKTMPAHDITITALWEINNYTLTFVYNDGTESVEFTLDFDEVIDYPEDIKKEGYTFERWDKSVTNMPASDLTITALWEINNYTLMFIYDNGTEPEEMILNFSQAIIYPDNVTKEGYSFIEWDNEVKSMPAHDLTITALWEINNYTLIFIYDNGTVPEERILNFSQTIDFPDDVTKEGHTFNNWDKSITIMPAHDLTITALWIINNYTLTFIYDNGTVPEERILNFSQVVIYPDNVTKEGYTFNNWDKSITIMPAHDLTITALWTINNYTLMFIYDNGTESEERILNFSQFIIYPEDIKKEGHTFVGWDNEVKSMPAYDITITALWEINNYTLTFIYDNGTEPEERILNFSQVVIYPGNVTKEGYTFNNWDYNVTNMPAHDLIITALWIINNYTISFDLKNGKTVERIFTYNKPIMFDEYKPSKPFYNFDNWCTEDGEKCLPFDTPAENIKLVPHFTVNAAAVAGTAVAGVVGFPLLLLLIIILVVVLLMIKNNIRVGHDGIDVELTLTGNENSDEEDERIIEEFAAINISDDSVGKRLDEYLKTCEKNIEVNEALAEIGIDFIDNKYSVSESFKIFGVIPAIANCISAGINLTSIASYLSLLYTNVREEEKFKTFKKVYFGMKDVKGFMEKKKEEEISFGGIISSFIDKKRVIRLLSENEEDNLPRGVLFKVQSGKGYNVGEQDEILLELNSKFVIERVEEIIQGRYIVVKLLYTTPNSSEDLINFKTTYYFRTN